MTGKLVVLTVAHRNHRPEERGDDELFAACQRCHLRYDMAHHAKSRRANKEAERRRVLDKAGQLAFGVECETGRPVGR